MTDLARLMGVVNVTPDSFSDGGLFLDAEAAIAHGRELAAEGAAILDVGGESTRPGAAAVGAALELERIGPVVDALAGPGGPGSIVSIDTSKAAVAEAALDAGAAIVNDVTALRGDPELAPLCAQRGCEVVLMHMQGSPRTMQEAPSYGDVVDDVLAFPGSTQIRGSGSGRRQITISSFCGGSASFASSGARSSSAHRASASSAP